MFLNVLQFQILLYTDLCLIILLFSIVLLDRSREITYRSPL